MSIEFSIKHDSLRNRPLRIMHLCQMIGNINTYSKAEYEPKKLQPRLLTYETDTIAAKLHHNAS